MEKTDEKLDISGDLSLFVAFNTTTTETHRPQTLLGEGDTGGAIRDMTYWVAVDRSGHLIYRHTSVSGEIEFRTAQEIEPGFHTVWLTRDTTTNRVQIGIDGEEPESFSYGFDDEPRSSAPAEFNIGATQNTGPRDFHHDSPLKGSVFEARVWDRTVDEEVLTSIANEGQPVEVPHQACEERINRPLVEGCLNSTDVVLEQVAPTVDETEEDVAGHLDRYAFDAGETTVLLTCVVLETDGQEVNPCAEAGGAFRERIATLVDQSPDRAEPAEEAVRICTGNATILTAGAGVERAPMLMPCEGV